MSTHDIELPPLPKPAICEREVALYSAYAGSQIVDYARAAIEADRKRRGEPVACFKCGHAKHGGECVNVAPQPTEDGKDDFYLGWAPLPKVRKEHAGKTNSSIEADDSRVRDAGRLDRVLREGEQPGESGQPADSAPSVAVSAG